MHTSGYSQTPLAKKLGIKTGSSLLLINQPAHYFKLFADFPEAITMVKQPENESIDVIHVFVTEMQQLEKEITFLKPFLKKTGHLWVSWPKGASSIRTELKREPIRELVVAHGLVDTKVCAVDSDWSGLKFMYRLKDR